MPNNRVPHESGSPEVAHKRLRWLWLLAAGGVLLILIGILRPPHSGNSPALTVSETQAASGEKSVGPAIGRAWRFAHRSSPVPASTAEEIVAGKLSQFARSRREFVHALARRHKVEVSEDAERFFAAIESGHWEDIEAAFQKINGGDSSAGQSANRPPGIQHLWPAIIDAYGAAEQVHEWPAQQLLDYGNAVLGSLRPGMVYIGGTDNGRWIPELLNDTSDGERHVIITQNGLADATYLDYVRLQYEDRLATLSDEDSQRAFKEYVADAEQRLKHDREHPGEPKQIRAGEDVRTVDGKTQVSGAIAVMAINEKLLQSLMEKNPGLSFALQESFPFMGTYAGALPLGPLMELRAQDGQNTFNAERAAESLDYWRNTAQQIFSDPEAAGLPAALKSYSHDATAAANLLAAHNFPTEAEQAYRLSNQLWPGNPEPVCGLAAVLARGGHEAEAQQLLEDFARKYPDQRKDLERISGAVRVEGPAQPARR